MIPVLAATDFMKRIEMPDGARLLECKDFRMTSYKPNDTFVQRRIYDVNGTMVVILRYDWKDTGLTVFIGDRAKSMELDQVSTFVRENTTGL